MVILVAGRACDKRKAVTSPVRPAPRIVTCLGEAMSRWWLSCCSLLNDNVKRGRSLDRLLDREG